MCLYARKTEIKHLWFCLVCCLTCVFGFSSGLATLGAQEKLNTFGRQTGKKSIHVSPDFTCVNVSLCNKKKIHFFVKVKKHWESNNFAE